MHTAFAETEGPDSDEALAARAQAGERDALEQLLVRHRPWIFNLAIRMLRQRTGTQDATQEILLRVLRSLDSFRGESRFRTWLYRVAANHLLNFRRKEWVASQAICSFDVAAAGLKKVPDFDPPDPRTVQMLAL